MKNTFLHSKLLFFFLFLLFVSDSHAYRSSIAYWRPPLACSVDYGPNISVNGDVHAIATDGTTTYIGGVFTTVQGVTRNNLAALDAAGNVLPFDPSVSDVIYSLQLSGSTLYAGGDFTAVGTGWVKSRGAQISNTGVINTAFPAVDNTINVVIPDGNGGWYIGGDFLNVGGVSRQRLARINSDGTLHAFNPSASAAVSSLALSGTTLYVGGAFTTIGGQTRNRIAALVTTLNTNNATPWNPDSGGAVTSLVLSGTTLYVGGAFTTIGGQTRNRIAALNTLVDTNNATTWNPNANNGVATLALSGTTLYAGGTFTSIGGQTRNYIAALNTAVDTNNATTWNPGATGFNVQGILLSGTTLYVGGQFTAMGGQSRTNIAALNTAVDTNNATAWNPSAVGLIVKNFALNGTTLYVGGTFTSIGGQLRDGLAALDTTVDTNNALAWNPGGTSAQVNSLALSGSNLYIGGTFVTAGGTLRRQIAAFNTSQNTNNVTNWNPNGGGTVYTMLLSGTKLFVGGNFTFMGGQTRSRIAAVDTTIDTNNATTWNPSANNIVRAFALAGTTLYVGGQFTTLGGQTRNYIGALDTTIDTSNATSWNPGADAIVRTLLKSGTTLYVGGQFTTIGGQTRSRLAALDTTIDTNNATTWNPTSGNYVESLALSGTTLYVGGQFTTIGGQSRTKLAALDTLTDTNNATAWNPQMAGGFNQNGLVMLGSTLYVGGGFTTLGGSSSHVRFAVIKLCPP